MESHPRTKNKRAFHLLSSALAITCAVQVATRPAAAATQGGQITRKEVAQRAENWIAQRVTYNTNLRHTDGYRKDCSGYVSEALFLAKPGLSTIDLPRVLRPISKAELKPGDIIGKLGPRTGGASGHVLLFERWLDANRYVAFELHGPQGAVVGHYTHRYPYDGRDGYRPYRYNKISECSGFMNGNRCCTGACTVGCPC